MHRHTNPTARRRGGLLAALVLALGTLHMAPASAQAGPVVAGQLWLDSSPEIRRAFLLGAANMIALEKAHASREDMPTPGAAQDVESALQGVTLDALSNRITGWYQANPGRLDVPVMGVIWMGSAAASSDEAPTDEASTDQTPTGSTP